MQFLTYIASLFYEQGFKKAYGGNRTKKNRFGENCGNVNLSSLHLVSSQSKPL